MKIWANTIVKNEENFIWFAVSSVIDHVDKVLLWDTGSSDNTLKIIKELIKKYGEKISFKEIGEVDKFQFTKLRQEMLDQSNCDWILVLDGDEIWWEESIKKLRKKIDETKNLDGIFVSMIIPVGDIYHLQDPSAGRYKIKGYKGNFSLRAINRKIPGLHTDLPYGQEGFYDEENIAVQERKDIVFLDTPYLHLTHLIRSSKKSDKYKLELGKRVSSDFKFPEVLYKEFPEFIFSPWIKISSVNKLGAGILTPLRKLKRRLI